MIDSINSHRIFPHPFVEVLDGVKIDTLNYPVKRDDYSIDYYLKSISIMLFIVLESEDMLYEQSVI